MDLQEASANQANTQKLTPFSFFLFPAFLTEKLAVEDMLINDFD